VRTRHVAQKPRLLNYLYIAQTGKKQQHPVIPVQAGIYFLKIQRGSHGAPYDIPIKKAPCR
jgi:hypothetical protein